MKKLLIVFVAVALVSTANAQKGNNQIGIGVELGLPTGDFGDAFKLGIGGSVKGLYGIGSAGQMTLTAGYTSHGLKSDLKEALGYDKYTTSIIPILLGYRHNFSGFYAEPQVGYGIYGYKVEEASVSASDSEGAFTWAIGLGFAKSGFDGGVRYQSASKDGTSTSFVGIRIGYNFSLGGDKK